MEANICTLAGLAALDTADIDAVMRINEACLARLLDPVLWAWVFGITLVCLLGGALIGWIKGRVVAGIVWAALLGPIGWLVVALSKSAQVECPKCRRGNPVDAKSCRHCGVNLKAAAERSPRSELKQVDRNSGW